MVEVLEKTQQIISFDLTEAKDKPEKVDKEKRVKAKLSSPKNYAKLHENSISIKKAKARLDAKMYGIRLNFY